MERDNFEISQELEQMREQFKVLTDKVEKQNIVNDRLLAASIKSKVSRYTYGKWGWMSVIILGLVTFLNLYFCITRSFPLWCIMLVGAVCVLFIGITVYNIIKEKDLDFKGNVNEFSAKVKSVKKSHIITSIISRVSGYAMLIPFVYYYFTRYADPVRTENVKSLIIFIIIMTVFGVSKEIKRIRLLDDILKDIE